jgi:hypothetical protein
MSLEILVRTLDVVGKVLVAYTAIAVHHRVWRNHKIDKGVFRMMRAEQWLGVFGIILIVLGYLIEIFIVL